MGYVSLPEGNTPYKPKRHPAAQCDSRTGQQQYEAPQRHGFVRDLWGGEVRSQGGPKVTSYFSRVILMKFLEPQIGCSKYRLLFFLSFGIIIFFHINLRADMRYC